MKTRGRKWPAVVLRGLAWGVAVAGALYAVALWLLLRPIASSIGEGLADVIDNEPAGDGPRIVSFLPSGTETLFALGLGDCVVGRSRFCDFPPEAKALPAVGDLFSADEDALAALRPTHAVLGRADAPQAALLRALGG